MIIANYLSLLVKSGVCSSDSTFAQPHSFRYFIVTSVKFSLILLPLIDVKYDFRHVYDLICTKR